MSTPRIQLSGVRKTFGHRVVLDRIDLDVPGGQVLGMMGPNGGGKSTLLLLMAGLISPSAGTATVDGTPAHALSASKAGTVGLITAEHGLYPLLTGRENLAFFGGLFGLDPTEVAARAGPLLDELALAPHLDTPAGAYSSGMKQKLSLVRARLLEPTVLLLDEPTANLDPLSADVIHRAVRREADRGLAVVLVSHDLHALEGVADRVLLVNQRVLHDQTFDGPREALAPSTLLEAYRAHVAPP